MIQSTANKGFKMEFSNGAFISVQFGYGNICSNRSFESKHNDYDSEIRSKILRQGKDAEILMELDGVSIIEKFYNSRNEDIKDELYFDGNVIGYANVDVIADAIYWAKNYKV